jgi:hypothetical protein
MEVADVEKRFGDLHDAVTKEISLRMQGSGVDAEVWLQAQELAPDQSGEWSNVRIQLHDCDEFRLSQGPHDNIVIFAARFVLLEDAWWLVLDASQFDDASDLTVADCRSSGHYMRARSISFTVTPI